VLAGFHFRFAIETGVKVGCKIGQFAAQHAAAAAQGARHPPSSALATATSFLTSEVRSVTRVLTRERISAWKLDCSATSWLRREKSRGLFDVSAVCPRPFGRPGPHRVTKVVLSAAGDLELRRCRA
jgi:hypothetical protein